MPIPGFQAIMLPALKILGDNACLGKEEINNLLAIEFGLSEEERNRVYDNNPKIIFNDRVAWAKTYLKKAGLLYYPAKGITQITEEGKKVLASNPKIINNKYLKQFDSFKEFRKLEKNDSTVEVEDICENEQTPDEMIGTAKTLIMAQLEGELMTRISENSPTFFESLVAKLLCKMGYGGSEKDILQSRGKSGDEGIDGIIKQDVLGLDKIYIQAKRWTSNVSRPEIQKFVGAVHGQNASRGVFITTSRFSKEAIDYTKHINSNIVLIDGKMLTKLMIDYNIGVQTKDVIEIKKIDIDFFEDED